MNYDDILLSWRSDDLDFLEYSPADMDDDSYFFTKWEISHKESCSWTPLLLLASLSFLNTANLEIGLLSSSSVFEFRAQLYEAFRDVRCHMFIELLPFSPRRIRVVVEGSYETVQY